MPSRTVRGAKFTIVVGGHRIVIKHVPSKGKRCRVIAPPGVIIESHHDRGTLSPLDTGNEEALPDR